MISLKIKNYSKEDKENLLHILESASANIASTICRTTSCEDCSARKVCRDISLAITYLVNNLTEEKQN